MRTIFGVLGLLSGCIKPGLSPTTAPRPKNIILFIGDGMGPQQVGLLELYARRAPSDPFKGAPTAFARLAKRGSLGMSMHDPGYFLVTDSACSATQLALGQSALVESLGVDTEGQPQQTILELAKENGLATGLVSDTRITHATPAGFASHVAHRSSENTIAEQELALGVDVMLSGGRRHFLPKGKGSKRDDDHDLLQQARSAGYEVVDSRAALQSVHGDRILGLFSTGGMLDAITERRTRDDADRTEPSLREMSLAALDHLSTDPDGFFVMIEAGQVDWAGHANDAGWMLHEMVRVNETLHGILDWVETHPDTLLVVTADHETGGFGFSYNRVNPPAPVEFGGPVFAEVPFAPHQNYVSPAVLDQLYAQASPLQSLLRDAQSLPVAEQAAELADALQKNTGFNITHEAAERVLANHPDPFGDGDVPAFHDFAAFYPREEYGRSGLVARELATAQGVVWATGSHTHTPVPVFAVGPGSEQFNGLMHHTELGQWLRAHVKRSLHRVRGRGRVHAGSEAPPRSLQPARSPPQHAQTAR